jgi:hypothetical protein
VKAPATTQALMYRFCMVLRWPAMLPLARNQNDRPSMPSVMNDSAWMGPIPAAIGATTAGMKSAEMAAMVMRVTQA